MSNNPHIPGGFKTVDITFKEARRQSEILSEITSHAPEERKVEPPKSHTIEQLTNYYLRRIQATGDQEERRVYAHTIKYFEKITDMESKLRKYQLKELREQSMAETPDDIQE